MKKNSFFSFIALVIYSCSNNVSNGTDQASSSIISNDPKAKEGLELVASSDCFSCHKVADKMVGPSYKAIAERYSNTNENRKSLAQKIIKGGSGNWGTLPMNAHPGITPTDAEKMAAYILSIQ